MTATHLHWHNATSSVRVKDYFDLQLGRMLQASSLTSDDREVDYVSVSAVQWGRFVAARVSQMYADTAEVARYSLHPGDLLVCEGGEGGRAAVFPGAPERNLIFQNHVIRANARSDRETSNRYLRYVLECASCLGWLTATLNGATIRSLSKGQLGRLQIPWPAVDEQRLIVRYLDHAEMRIAIAIAGKNDVLVKLREAKTAVISELVLGDSSDRVDTGVPGIGAAPRHWRRRRAKYVWRTVDVRSKTGSDERLTVSSARGIVPRSSTTVTMFEAASYVGHKIVEPGDLVINSLWAWATGLGVSKHRGIVSPVYGVYRLTDDQCDTAYLDFLLRSNASQWQFQVRSKGIWKSRLSLTDEAFLDMLLVLPPLDEQKAIAQMITSRTAAIDAAMAAVENEIALLKEYRVRLISDVVTGKLAVRKEAASLKDVDPSELAAVLAGGATSTGEEEAADGDE